MRILWVSNSPIGPAATILGETYKGTSGGWIQSEYEAIDKKGNQFFFLSSLKNVRRSEILHRKNEFGEVFCVNSPRISYGIHVPTDLQDKIQSVIDQVEPDIIQIWGTETWISNAVSKCKTSAPRIIFIQGLLGIHQRYIGGYFGKTAEEKRYLRGLSLFGKIKSWIRHKNFNKQAKIEKETIYNCKNVIVDSEFAKAYCSSIAPDIMCHQHVLLPNNCFFQKQWDLDKSRKHTIFTVYGSSAEKGIQNLLKAVTIVKRKFSDIKVIIPGGYQLDSYGKLKPSKKDPFQNTLYNIISDLNLSENVEFTGRLNVAQMASTIEKSHIFVNPSCMEVHALSLRESMVVGLPCISTQCGSVLEYIQHNVNGLIYRYEEFEMLAYYIEKLFNDDEAAKRLSRNANKALEFMQEGALTLNAIYEKILLK